MSMNSMIRYAGNRSRMLPDIGQGQMDSSGSPPNPSPTSSNAPSGPVPSMTSPQGAPLGGMTPSGGGQAPTQPGPASPMQAPRVQPQTFTMHPPGAAADPNQYNYEPQPDGSWRVYPPGVNAPPHTASASLPRAASTGDYIRMSRAFQAAPAAAQPQQPQYPPNQVQSI